MAAAPDLLDDDGRVSMATMLLMSHHALRRDLARFTRALADDAGDVAALRDEWAQFHDHLHGHHTAEDEQVFPAVLGHHPELAAMIDQLTLEHRRIDPLLAQGDAAFAGLPASRAAALAVIEELQAMLEAHLELEEMTVVPRMRGDHAFPPPAGDDEVGLYAAGFAWSLDGIAPDIVERVYAMLPEVLTRRIPTQRIAFAARTERVWGKPAIGASRTAVPDWLADA